MSESRKAKTLLRRAMVSALVVAGVATGLVSPAAVAQTVLRLSSWAPPQHPVSTEIMGGWARDVERVTNGEVKVEILQTPVGAPASYFDLVRNGVVDVSFVTHDFTPNRFVLTRIAELPFVGESGEAASVALWRTQEKYFDKADEHAGVKVLGLMVHGPGYLYTTGRSVASLDALRGAKIRASAGVMTDVVSALDAVPVPAPPTKSYEMMSNGVIEGTLFPAESITGFNLTPLVKQVLKAPGGFYKSSFVIMMNPAKWNALTDAQKQAIWSVSGESLSRRAGAVWDRSDQAAEAKLAEAGIQVVTARGEHLSALEKRLEPLRIKWLEQAGTRGVDGEKALAYFRAQLKSSQQ